MERNANYFLVGLSTLILLAGMAIFAAWLVQLRFAQDYDVYDIIFHGPVRGLTKVAKFISTASRSARSPRSTWTPRIRRA